VAAEHNSTTIFPIPIDLFTPYLKNVLQSVAPPAQGGEGGTPQT
jgi:hypothetical protein